MFSSPCCLHTNLNLLQSDVIVHHFSVLPAVSDITASHLPILLCIGVHGRSQLSDYVMVVHRHSKLAHLPLYSCTSRPPPLHRCHHKTRGAQCRRANSHRSARSESFCTGTSLHSRLPWQMSDGLQPARFEPGVPLLRLPPAVYLPHQRRPGQVWFLQAAGLCSASARNRQERTTYGVQLQHVAIAVCQPPHEHAAYTAEEEPRGAVQ